MYEGRLKSNSLVSTKSIVMGRKMSKNYRMEVQKVSLLKSEKIKKSTEALRIKI